MNERGAADVPAAGETAEIISALRQAATAEQAAALVASLHAARARAADRLPAPAYQDPEADGGVARRRADRRLRAA